MIKRDKVELFIRVLEVSDLEIDSFHADIQCNPHTVISLTNFHSGLIDEKNDVLTVSAYEPIGLHARFDLFVLLVARAVAIFIAVFCGGSDLARVDAAMIGDACGAVVTRMTSKPVTWKPVWILDAVWQRTFNAPPEVRNLEAIFQDVFELSVIDTEFHLADPHF